MSETVKIKDTITVSELADSVSIPVTELMAELMKNGVMVTMNDTIDFDTAQIMVGELDLDINLEKIEDDNLDESLQSQSRDMVKPIDRPPVVAVMGHVDHGKTTLLDAIRGAKVVDGEAGGITQHISAYQIEHKNRLITLLDTPGHEAFASLRQHGAHLTDLVILVVAADDGVKPQTKEAIKYAQNAGVKIMVAINKIDKPDANINRVLQELNDSGLVPEEWGGDTVVVKVSAIKKQGIDELLDMAFLVSDVEELKADGEGFAQGIVIESHMEQGRGAVVSVLVEHGLLKKGDYLVAGQTYAKVKTLEGYDGQTINLAGPSTPAIVTGFKETPDFGVLFEAVKDEKSARAFSEQQKIKHGKSDIAVTSSELLAQIHKDRSTKELPVMVKADVRGSATSVVEGLQLIKNPEVSIRVISSGVGAISESDITQAASSGAIVYGFNINVPVNIKRLANREGVSIRIYKVIYELIEDAKLELEQLLIPQNVEEISGRLTVKGVFKTTKTELICGGEVNKGKISVGELVRIYDKKEHEEPFGQVVSVQKEHQETKEVQEGDMCGLSIKTEQKEAIVVGDKLEFFTRKQVKRKLN